VRRVALAGGTGLVGREVLRRLLVDPGVAEVVALVRRAPGWAPHPKLRTEVVDFARLEAHEDALRVDQVACALGTTRKQAGSRSRFRAVDFGIPFSLARVALAQGARHFLLVSALGADPGSRVFYNRVKGELEEAVRTLPYRSVTLLRPSLLLGDRAEFRLGEEVAKRLSFLFPPPYRPVEAAAVAEALVAAARADASGVRVIASREIRRRFG
jgi:uncharacterized protein YbjT (DUF2867 family)